MNAAPSWKVSKWPFLFGRLLLLATTGFAVVFKAGHPILTLEFCATIACVALAAVLGCLPYVLEYRATDKLIEVNAVGTSAGQLHDLQKYAEQISSATERWAHVQEATKGHADKTVAAAGEIAEKMATEIREFSEFQTKLNDTEKGALRLEVEKMRRAEGEWLQVVARILDHIFALHNAASRSGNPDLADQIANFQNACRDAARRVGLMAFIAAPGEAFDARKHRAHGAENPPADAVIAETLAAGMTYQGRLVRPALVQLQDGKGAEAPGAAEIPAPKAEPMEASNAGELALETE